MDFINLCSTLETEISGLKVLINSLEIDRISSMLKSLKEDETRLKECIDDIQNFHRDMFVLASTTEDPADPKNGKMKSAYHVTEPECSENKSSNSKIAPEASLQVLRLRRKIPNCLINKEDSLKNNLEHESYEEEEEPCEIVYEVCNIKDESDDDKNASYDIKYESDYVKDAIDCTKSDSDSTKNDSDSTKNDSESTKSDSCCTKNDSCCTKSEFNDNKDGFSEEENNLARKLLLDSLANREAEVTILLLDLLSKFASFQNNLEIAETKVSQLGEIYPEVANVTVNNLLDNLHESVLNLDKAISKVYEKYFELLDSIKMGKVVQ